jgi:hypothetical protein
MMLTDQHERKARLRFDSYSIKKTASRIEIRTESSNIS